MGVQTTPVIDIARKDFVSVDPKERVNFAERLFEIGKFRHLPVVEEGRLVGILSTRDVMEAALTKLMDFDPGHRKAFLHSIDVSEVMSREVTTVRPETPLSEAALRMVQEQIGCLPVVDKSGHVLGLVTETDLLRAAYLGPRD